MNRRNTIIIAVLVNAGLLLVLFATAIRSGDKKEESTVKLAEAPIQSKEATSTPVTTEELLNEYIAASVPSDQEEVVVLEDIVNGSNIVETPIASSPSATQLDPKTTSSMPSIQPAAVVQVQNPPAQKPQTGLQAPKSQLSTPQATNSEVIVKKGDYLEKIAKANHTTVNAIMQANNLASTNLKIGQVLKIPGKIKAVDELTPTTTQPDYYIVKEGDSPWLIASKCNVKLDALLRLNNIDEQKAKKLRPGDKLRIR